LAITSRETEGGCFKPLGIPLVMTLGRLEVEPNTISYQRHTRHQTPQMT
jgi:hypothetical protein